MFSEVLQPLGIIIFCRQPMQCTIIFTASYMFSFWKCGYQANAKNTRKTLNVVRLMQVCRGSSMIWLYSSRTAFHHGICWMRNECQGDYYIIAYKKSETFFFFMKWCSYISSDEKPRHIMPIAMWMGRVCLNLFLFRNILSEKAVVRPEMSNTPQPAGKQWRKENEPCKIKSSGIFVRTETKTNYVKHQPNLLPWNSL